MSVSLCLSTFINPHPPHVSLRVPLGGCGGRLRKETDDTRQRAEKRRQSETRAVWMGLVTVLVQFLPRFACCPFTPPFTVHPSCRPTGPAPPDDGSEGEVNGTERVRRWRDCKTRPLGTRGAASSLSSPLHRAPPTLGSFSTLIRRARATPAPPRSG